MVISTAGLALPILNVTASFKPDPNLDERRLFPAHLTSSFRNQTPDRALHGRSLIVAQLW